MLFNALNPLLKYPLVALANLGNINYVSHDLIMGFFLVIVDGFDFQVKSLLPRFKSLFPGFEEDSRRLPCFCWTSLITVTSACKALCPASSAFCPPVDLQALLILSRQYSYL